MSMLLPPGEVIPGTRYRILRHVADGAMGTVYAAEHVDLEKQVALKTLLADGVRTPDAIERFRQEARAASKIGSPFICDVTDFGELPNGQVFFVMEYLAGHSLAHVLHEEEALDAGRTVAILRQVCKALGAGHEKGIVHLDVKPDNVMLIADKKRGDGVKVVDFGVAGLVDTAEDADRIAGTPEYIAPERALGKGYDHRSDVYSLGVMAYEMLTGVVPFADDELVAVLKMHVTDKPEPPSKRAPGRNIPTALENLVLQMMSKDPAQRPQRMEVVEAMLCEAQIAAGLRTEWDHLDLPPVDEVWQKKLADRMPSPRGRQRKGLVIGALGLATVAAALAVYFGAIRGPEIKIVRVAVTETEESEAVGAWLEKADAAARNGNYTRPDGGSSLHFLVTAETEARKEGRRSKGAERLRRTYASALTVTGNELSKAGLRELAQTKYREALGFLPADKELQKAAAVSADEAQAIMEAKGTRVVGGKRSAGEDDASDEGARLFLAARKGRYSEARVAAKALTANKDAGSVKARVADALRGLANGEWDSGDRKNGRSLYQLVLELDPEDLEAQSRTRLELEVPPVPAVAVAPPEPTPPLPSDEDKNKRSKRSTTKPETELDVVPETPRDEAAASKAVAGGRRSLAQGRLPDAEKSFNEAVRADPLSAAAIGGLAEVAFERAQYPEAMDYARRASRIAPRAAEYQIIYGDALFKLLRYTEAKVAYQKAETLAGRRNEQIAARLDRVNTKLGQ